MAFTVKHELYKLTLGVYQLAWDTPRKVTALQGALKLALIGALQRSRVWEAQRRSWPVAANAHTQQQPQQLVYCQDIAAKTSASHML